MHRFPSSIACREKFLDNFYGRNIPRKPEKCPRRFVLSVTRDHPIDLATMTNPNVYRGALLSRCFLLWELCSIDFLSTDLEEIMTSTAGCVSTCTTAMTIRFCESPRYFFSQFLQDHKFDILSEILSREILEIRVPIRDVQEYFELISLKEQLIHFRYDFPGYLQISCQSHRQRPQLLRPHWLRPAIFKWEHIHQIQHDLPENMSTSSHNLF
jgi:hypothetical protein